MSAKEISKEREVLKTAKELAESVLKWWEKDGCHLNYSTFDEPEEAVKLARKIKSEYSS